jgi:cysteinyl-tRNA synthetase
MNTVMLILLSGFIGTVAALAPIACTLEGQASRAFREACNQGDVAGKPAITSRPSCGPRADSESHLAAARTLMVQFQRLNPMVVQQTNPDVLITDYSWDGGGGRELSRQDVNKLRWRLPQRPRIVLAYVSVGEAEDYRYYWTQAAGGGSASFLDRPNPKWPGNVRVRFWDPAWHRVLYSGRDSWIDRIVDAGFDGVFLDTVDAAESWAEDGRRDAPDQMNRLIASLAAHARKKVPGFLVIASNPFVLLERTPVADALSGIVAEDHLLKGDTLRPPEAIEAILTPLRRAAREGLTILAVEYPGSRPGRERFASLCSQEGFLCYSGVRALDRPGTMVPLQTQSEVWP